VRLEAETNIDISGGAQTEQTCFKQLVSSKVKKQLHETAALSPDNKTAKRLHRVL